MFLSDAMKCFGTQKILFWNSADFVLEHIRFCWSHKSCRIQSGVHMAAYCVQVYCLFRMLVCVPFLCTDRRRPYVEHAIFFEFCVVELFSSSLP